MKYLSDIKNFLLFFIWFFSVTFSIFPVGTGKIASIYFIFYVMASKGNELKVIYIKFVIALSIAIFYFMIFTIINGNYDLSLPYLLLLHIFEFIPGALYFSTLINRKKISEETICIYFMISGIVLSFFVFLLLSSPAMRDLSNSYIPQYGNIDALRITRVRGFSNGGGADHSIQLAMCAIGSFVLFNSSNSTKVKFFSFFSIIFVLIALVFVARTGVVLLISTYFIYLLSTVNKLIKNLIYVIALTLIIYILLPVIISTLDYLTNGVFSDTTLPWFMQIFSVITTGEVNSSNSQLIDMLYLPNDFIRIMFGNGSYTNFGVYTYSDSGYVKFVFSFGLPLTISLVIFILYILFSLIRKGCLFDKLFSITLFSLVLLTIKEPFLIKIGTAHLFYIMLFRYIYLNRKFSIDK